MKDEERSIEEKEMGQAEPALTPLGTPPAPPIHHRAGDIIHPTLELAVGEADVRSAEAGEVIAGTSLWKDAWRRLLKNKLAVFGMIVVGFMIVITLVGPFIIKKATGY
ncbi:MAG TPA: hypothetical protein VGC64_05980, partial [Pyrinomonadaceae bacterium]